MRQGSRARPWARWTADLILADGRDTLTILAQQGPYGEGLAEVVDQRYTAGGGRVVHREFLPPLHRQLGSGAAIDTAALVDADPDALVLVMPFPDVEAVARALVEDGFTVQDTPWYLTGGVYDYGSSLPPGALAGAVGTQQIVQEAPDEFLVRVEEFAGV